MKLANALVIIGGVLTLDAVAEAAPARGGYSYSTDWTSPYADSWLAALAELRGRPGLRYLEIGIWEGRSTIWMFENVLTDPTSSAVGLDIVLTERLRHNVEVSGLGPRLEVLEGDSATLLRPMKPASFDIIYVDASHLAKNVLTDATLSWPLLKAGGVMIFDDYRFGAEPNLPADLRPRLAIDTFLTAFRNELSVLHRDYQVIVKKRTAPCSDRCDQCSRIGDDYVYSWNVFGRHYPECTPQGLFRVRGDVKTRVPLAEPQEQAVRQALRAMKVGQTDVAMPADVRRALAGSQAAPVP